MYREWPVTGGLADRIWTRRGDVVPPSLPQPAVDLLLLPNGTCLLTGPETRTRGGLILRDGGLSGLRLRPGAVRRLFGLAADEVPVDGAPVADLAPGALGRRLASAGDTHEILRVLAVHRAERPDAQIEQVLNAVHDAPGTPVTGYAGLAGLSERQLRRRFKIEVGLGLKAYAQVVRLHHALAMARSAVRPDWTDIAQRSGFYDQPHLLASFRDAVGLTPGALLSAEDGRFFQAEEPQPAPC